MANVVTVGSDKPHVTPTATNSLLTTISLHNTSSWKATNPWTCHQTSDRTAELKTEEYVSQNTDEYTHDHQDLNTPCLDGLRQVRFGFTRSQSVILWYPCTPQLNKITWDTSDGLRYRSTTQNPLTSLGYHIHYCMTQDLTWLFRAPRSTAQLHVKCLSDMRR